jgi:hypothetical protein
MIEVNGLVAGGEQDFDGDSGGNADFFHLSFLS